MLNCDLYRLGRCPIHKMGMCIRKEEKEEYVPLPLPIEKVLFYAPFTEHINGIYAWDGKTSHNYGRYSHMFDGWLQIDSAGYKNVVGLDDAYLDFTSNMPFDLSGITISFWRKGFLPASAINWTIRIFKYSSSILDIIDYVSIVKYNDSPHSINIYDKNTGIENIFETSLDFSEAAKFYTFTVCHFEDSVFVKVYINGILLYSDTKPYLSVDRYPFGEQIFTLYSPTLTTSEYQQFSITETLTDQEVLDLYNMGGVINV
jgi:hypothetical protein